MPVSPARPSGTFPRSYTRIDWKQAARLIAAGSSAEQAAEAIGIDEDRLWRHWHRSQRFRDYVQSCLERRRGLLGLQLGSAAPAAALARCRAPDSLAMDAAMLAMLAGDDFAAAPAGEDAGAKPASIGERVAALGAAGYRPRRRQARPTAATTRRQQAPPRPPEDTGDESPAPRMVVVRRLALSRIKSPVLQQEAPAAGIGTPDVATLDVATPDVPTPVANEPGRAETVPNGPERTETGQNGQQRAAPAAAQPVPAPQDDESPSLPPPRFRARPDFITDLPSPDFPDGIPYARDMPDEAKPPRWTG